jgi:NAD(P)-dependent dehydrogenase (short-subunit alcohol dehydrogenase family)
MKIKGAVALVTGTNRGIGPETVKALIEAGAAKVYATARAGKSPDALVALAPGRIVPLALDIRDTAQVAQTAAACADVTLLVNNAGVNFNTPLLGADPANARTEIETNYLGTLAMCRAFAPVLKKNGGGAIVNMLSILARVNLPLMGSLCASKAAGLSMTQGLRAQLAAQGTRVIAVMPGAVDTDMTKGIDIPKMKPRAVSDAILAALESETEDIYPGEMATGVSAGLAQDAKAVEKEFAAYLPG